MRPPKRSDALAVLAALFLCIPALAQEAPSDVVRAFFARYAAGDLRGAADLWIGGAPADGFRRAHRARLEKRCLRLETLTVEQHSLQAIDTFTTFALRTNANAPEWWESARSRFTLQQEGERWRIVSWEPLESDRETTTFVRLASQHAIDLVNQSRLDEAEPLTRLAFAAAERLGDPASMAASLSARSVVLRARRDFDLAAQLAEEAVGLAERGGDPEVLARALVRLGRMREELHGQPDPEPLERALALRDQLEDLSIAVHAAVHFGRSHELRGHYREAFRLAELAWRLAEQTNDRAARIAASQFLGGAYVWIGDPVLAERHNRRAAELAVENGFIESAAYSIAATAAAMSSRGDADGALHLLDEWVAKIADANSKASLIRMRAHVHLDAGHLDEAERDLHEATSLGPPTDASRNDFNIFTALIERKRGNDAAALAHLEAVTGKSNAAQYFRARILARMGRLEEARVLLEELMAERDSSPLRDPQQALFAESRLPQHRVLLELLVEQEHHAAALEVAEEVKATSLREGRAYVRTDAQDALEPEARAREQAIDERIRALNRRLLAADVSKEDAAKARKELSEARADLVDFRQRQYAKSPAMRAQYPPPVRIDELPAQLDDVTIVSYVLGYEKTFAFVIEPKRDGHRQLHVHTLDDRGLRERVAHLNTLLEQRNLRVGEHAAELYDVLLAPIEESIRSARRLCILPDAYLWRVPFQILGRRNEPPLVERVPVFYAPSLTVLAAVASTPRALHPPHKRTLLAFANPIAGLETQAAYRAFDPDAPLGALPETETEVRAIARIYGADVSRVYIGNAARETTLKREASKYDVLHIATHGVIYDRAPMFSSLLLTTAPEDRAEDGVLEAREIAGLALRAELAVLSACETGRSADGDGVVGLSWAFLAAGCPTTVVSQWNAQSAATEKLMVEFHRGLARGLTTPAALRQAQLALRRDARYRHPFYWGPFVVIGVP